MTRTLVCELCGRVFECKGSLFCWCARYKIKKLKELSKSAQDCVCESCLKAYS
ncbi:hypothetical protein B9Q11_03920 [Candidatus Marsarchaeota G2 archaeon ECH_B_SAG-F08]|uniref:Cysteine-rich CWC n=5 Tax=Candidatus Marsarchaeota TaxID=1978152 RepID=A0A2R6C049_9ARCH|nr:MAG: hypothetical protein B9Q02_07045 [Candidatus Marsarchaeota G1 archaeon BE_D]PSN95759.1 MAG: hypothetical protein B9P99_00810 [Candidatus Marsarchaeota G1 archaeon OSP_B]PSN97601.1 MAG: hypothetical protein B9Q11_03920 [Candidatus Marsarchaeota G2 archaeon ECH_B_SAG-F08]PSO04227.1 MAG: hypothetical protein B9Q12_02760 [Candidatus Marsarchaeota G2 archaeon ECH_B_SAG-G06]PSO05237.1 MAG: hypothetical protein B9Q13_02380 [Candidatus Marsarchaeota G2 archaeon ECH_B_SAG-G16]